LYDDLRFLISYDFENCFLINLLEQRAWPNFKQHDLREYSVLPDSEEMNPDILAKTIAAIYTRRGDLLVCPQRWAYTLAMR
jgi:hypothetical protein